MTTLTALARPSTFFHPGTPGRGFLVGFLGTLAVGLMLLAAVSIGVSVASVGHIMPGVRVAGVDVGGLDRAAATERLSAQLPSLASASLTVEVDGEPVEVPFADLDRSYQLDEMIDAAYGVARSGDLLVDALARLRVLAVPASLPPVVSGDGGAAIDAVVSDLVARFSVSATDAEISYLGDAGFVISRASDGATLDAVALRAAMVDALAGDVTSSASVSVATETVEPAIGTEAASAAALRANRIASAPLALRAGGKSYPLEPAELAALVSFEAAADGTYGPIIDEEGVRALVKPLAASVASEPRDAAFQWGVGGITGVVPAVDGRKLDVRASVEGVVQALLDRGNGVARRAVPLAIVASAPALTTHAAQAAASEMRVLGTWTTYYVPGEGNFWGANINIPAEDLDGMVIAPGEWFSFWDGIGPITLERGYGYGGAIIGGRSVPNGALAGGICSTSTTLFNAAMRSGLEIGERENHSYYIERYPVGLDATVLQTDTWETDMTFRNDTAGPIVIRGYPGNGSVRFDIWGVPDGRTVRLSSPTTWNHGTAIWTTVVNSSLAPGTSRIVEYPHDGFNASVTRWVYDAQGNVLHENVWISDYRTVNGITEVGPRRTSD